MNTKYSKIAYLMTIFFGIFALMSGSREIYYLFFLTIFLILSMYIIVSINSKNIFVMYYTSSTNIESGDDIKIEYKVSNTSFVPIAHAKIEFYLSERSQSASDLKEIAYFKNYQMINFKRQVVYPYRGYYKIGKVKIEIFDPLMLYKKILVFDKEIDLKVKPRAFKLTEKVFDTNELYGIINSNKKSIDDRTNIVNIRPFERGDQIKNIHWKLSAKLGKIQTKEFEQTHNKSFIVVLDGSHNQFLSGMTLETEEFMVSYCASYISYAISNDLNSKLFLTDKTNLLLESSDSSDFEKVIEALMGFQANSDELLVNRLQRISVQNGAQNNYYVLTYSINESLLSFFESVKKKGYNFKVKIFSSIDEELLNRIENTGLDIKLIERGDRIYD